VAELDKFALAQRAKTMRAEAEKVKRVRYSAINYTIYLYFIAKFQTNGTFLVAIVYFHLNEL